MRHTFYASFKIPTFGDHNILNALAVIALCHYEAIDTEIVKERLLTFEGVKRRFSEKVIGTQVLIDDYAHHPTEIKATINAARQKYQDREIVVIFQPHTFSRTQTFLDDFAESLSGADGVYLCDIFGSAREHHGQLTIEDLQERIPGSVLMKEGDTSSLFKHKDSVLIFMGAGDIQKFQSAYENYLNEQ